MVEDWCKSVAPNDEVKWLPADATRAVAEPTLRRCPVSKSDVALRTASYNTSLLTVPGVKKQSHGVVALHCDSARHGTRFSSGLIPTMFLFASVREEIDLVLTSLRSPVELPTSIDVGTCVEQETIIADGEEDRKNAFEDLYPVWLVWSRLIGGTIFRYYRRRLSPRGRHFVAVFYSCPPI
jgi:hypothetical protein